MRHSPLGKVLIALLQRTLNQNSHYACCQVGCQQPADHRTQSQLGQVRSPFRRQRADPANLDRDTPKIREPTQGIGRQRKTSLIQLRFGCGEMQVANERSEEHTSELQSLAYLVCRLLLEKK